MENAFEILINLLLALVFTLGGIVVGYVGWKLGLLWWRNKDREYESLHSTLLQISLPRDNEIKIDAAEQMFASLYAIRKTDPSAYFQRQPHLSFEIVGMPGDIRFYVYVSNKYRDLVEKQINGAYPEADITTVDPKHARQKEEYLLGGEYNIFSENAKIACRSLLLKTSDYLPIKVFKDLPTDPLSSITSVLSKMSPGEGASIQIVVSPAGDSWKKQGKGYIAKTKKNEANPETEF